MTLQKGQSSPASRFKQSPDILFHRVFDAHVIKHLSLEDKRSLRLVSKGAKAAVDATVTTVNFAGALDGAKIEDLLEANWNVKTLRIPISTKALLKDVMLVVNRWPDLVEFHAPDIGYLFKGHDQDLKTFNRLTTSNRFNVGTLRSLDHSMSFLTDQDIERLVSTHWASNLEFLDVSHNILKAQGVAAIGNTLLQLTYLDLSRNKLEDVHLEALSKLQQLQVLLVNDTGISGQCISKLSRNLTALELCNNPLDIDTYFTDIYFPNIKSLDLCEVGLKASALPAIQSGFPNLESLDLSSNEELGDNGLQALEACHFPYLRTLSLEYCGLSGSALASFIPNGHKICPDLEELNLSVNSFNVAAIEALGTSPWKMLRYLDLSNCRFNSESIRALANGRFENLEDLILEENESLYVVDVMQLVSINGGVGMPKLRHLSFNGLFRNEDEEELGNQILETMKVVRRIAAQVPSNP